MLTLRLFRKIHKMSHTLINIWLWTFCLHWNRIRIICLDWLLLQIKFYIISTSTILFHRYPNFLVSQESIVVHILQLNWTVKRNRHPYVLVWSVRKHFEYQNFFQLFCDFHQKGSICTSWRFNCPWKICIWVSMLEDYQVTKAYIFAFFTILTSIYAFFWRLNCSASEADRAAKIFMLALS